MATPDAVRFERSKKQGVTKYARIDSTATIAERLLGLDRSKGETGHIRAQPGGSEFITGNPTDTLHYPTGHEKEGQGPMYNWVQSTDDPDIYLGYLKDKPAEVAPTPGPLGDVIVQAVALDGSGVMSGVEGAV